MPTDPQAASKQSGPFRRGALVALGVIAAGVVAFFCALYGAAGSVTPIVFIASVALLIGGIAALLYSIRGAARSPPHPAAVVLLALGVLLHAYELAAESDSVAPNWLMLWALVPYALCAVLALFRALRLAAIAGTGATLLFDLWIHYTVFVHPTSSTAALALIFAPLLTSLVIAPLVTLGVWLSMRR